MLQTLVSHCWLNAGCCCPRPDIWWEDGQPVSVGCSLYTQGCYSLSLESLTVLESRFLDPAPINTPEQHPVRRSTTRPQQLQNGPLWQQGRRALTYPSFCVNNKSTGTGERWTPRARHRNGGLHWEHIRGQLGGGGATQLRGSQGT